MTHVYPSCANPASTSSCAWRFGVSFVYDQPGTPNGDPPRYPLQPIMHLAICTHLSLLLALSLNAQQDPEDSYGHSRHGTEFDEGPRQAAYLMQGMNSELHFGVTTNSELAQQFFNQGICQQHGFWYFEAERSFRQAALPDPDCAMAYWGMCVSNLENHKRALGFIIQAVQRSANVTPREKLWIDAWADRYQLTDENKVELRSGDAERITKAREQLLESKGKEPNRDEKKRLQRDLPGAVRSCW